MSRASKWVRIDWILLAILGLGFGLRVWGIDFGLPYTTAPDEAWHLTIALRMFRTGDLNPHWLNYPSLMFYLNALAYAPFFLIGKALGVLISPTDIPYPEIITVGVGKSLLPAQFLLGRGLTALFGVGSIGAVYWLARQWYPQRAVAWLAALFLAISPASVYNSHLIRPDTFVVLFVLLAVGWSLKVLDEPTLPHYLLAGVCAGLAVSSKYNVPLIAVALLAAHFLRWGAQGIRRKELYVGLGAMVLAFAVTTPFALLDVPQFLRDMGFETTKQISGGHTGFEGDALRWYLEFLWSSEGVLVVAALAAIIGLLWMRTPKNYVLLAFPLTYFVFISVLLVRNDRTILPVLPFLHLVAAWFVVRIYDWLRAHSVARQWALAIMLVLVGGLSGVPLQNAVASDLNLAKTNPDPARAWIETNLPRGSRVVVEAYGPYIDPAHFVVEGVDGIIAHPPEWYVANGIEYLVFSSGAYGRFYADPARYPSFIERYDAFFKKFPEMIRFNDDGNAVRLYKTGVTLPAYRVGARWGIYSNWVELVGYDVSPAQTGQPFTVSLYWRTLESRREPLVLTARLLDGADHKIAQTRGALFSAVEADGHWLPGISRLPLTFVAPAEPGSYRLELTMDAGEPGRVPVLSQSFEPISDKLFVGPFPVAPIPPTTEELAHAQSLNAKFGDAITLRGYSLAPASTHPGDPFGITLYWQSAAPVERDYTVFIHLLDANGNVRAQVDAQPVNGAYPTSLWNVGQIVRDAYALSLPNDLAHGDYKIEVGLYEYPSLARLGVNDNGKDVGDHLTLPNLYRVVGY